MPDLFDVYMAGLIDGDGSISLTRYRRENEKLYVVVQLSQIDSLTFRQLAARCGRSVYVARTHPSNRPGKVMAKIGWTGKPALELLDRIGPHLMLKQPQWRIIQWFQQGIIDGPEARRTIMQLNRMT